MPLAVVPDLEAELDRLYGLPLEEFTKARNDLASRLRKAGQRDAADDVKALPKPNVAAWIVNQLVRTRDDDVRELLAVGERLRKAQLAGRADALREAVADERRTVRSLVAAARDLGADRQGMPERVTAILRAAAVDDDARKLLETGRLSGDVEPTGFGALAALAPAPPTKGSAQERRQRVAEARKRVRRLSGEAARLRERAETAEHAADAARDAAREAEEVAERAAAEADDAAARLADSERELAQLEED